MRVEGHSCGRIQAPLILALFAACMCLTASAQGISVLAAPLNGQQNVPANMTFQWTASPGAQAYYLYVGTTRGAKDVVNTGHIQATSYTVTTPLPAGATLWARIYTELNGVWSCQGDTTFQTAFTAVLISPSNGATGVSPYQLFSWTLVPGAQVYNLIVSPTGYGVKDNFNGDFTGVSSGYVWDLQPNTLYYAELYTKTATGFATSYSTFTTGPGNPLPADRSGFYSEIQELTGQVRLMASTPGNLALPGSFLYQNMSNHWANPAIAANCGNFATALADLLTQNGILSRRRITTFDGADVHVIAEYWDPFNSKWQIADATFGVIYLNPNTLIGQGLEDVNALLLAGNLSAITPLWATSHGTYYMTTFYMNPILYYNNPFPYGLLQNFQEVYDNVQNSPLPFLAPVSLGSPTASPIGYYEFLFANPTDQITINYAGTTITVSPLSSAGWALTVGLYPGWSITSSIPAGMQIYTPIWPSEFPVANTSVLSSPANGVTVPSQNIQFAWTPVSNAINYTLWIGSTPGAQDVLSYSTASTLNPSGTTSTTVSLAAAMTYYVTLGALTSTGTTYTTSMFTTSAGSYLTAPLNGQQNVPIYTTFQWTASPGAQAYYLYVGTTQGAKDVVNTGHIQATSYTVTTPLPTGTTLWARIWTEIDGTWNYQGDTTFQTAYTATVTSPSNGATNLDPAVPITVKWVPIATASSYELILGSSVGANNYYDSGTVSSTSASVNLSPNTTYYARLWTNASGTLAYTDSVFSTGFALAHLTYPLNGATGVSQFLPFTWSQAPGATGYILSVSPTGYGTPNFYWSAGSSLVPTDTNQYVYFLQPNTTYYVQLCTVDTAPAPIGCVHTNFTTGAPLPPPTNQNQYYQTIINFTSQVNLMSQGFSRTAASGTALYDELLSYGADPSRSAVCGDYVITLLNILAQNNILGRMRSISLDGAEGHVVAEFWDPFNQQWDVADPFYGLVYLNQELTAGQSAEQIGALLLAGNYSSIDTNFVTPYGDQYMTTYYLDPMTFYTNVVPFGMITTYDELNTVPNSPLQFLNEVELNAEGQAGFYIFNFQSQRDSVTIQGQNYFSAAITPANTEGWAASVYLQPGWTITSAVPAGMRVFTFVRVMF